MTSFNPSCVGGLTTTYLPLSNVHPESSIADPLSMKHCQAISAIMLSLNQKGRQEFERWVAKRRQLASESDQTEEVG
jgi:hypothetical protein